MTMQILEYSNLNIAGLETKYEKVKSMLVRDDFFSAQVKKLKNMELYSARLDHANRVLFKPITYNAGTYALILEIVRNHDYANARFFNGAKITGHDIAKIEEAIENKTSAFKAEEVKYVNQNTITFHFLNKFLSFDDEQLLAYEHSLPLIIIGSAGSGKTMLALEKMKLLSGNGLYVSLSSYLVSHARNTYYSHNYQNFDQEITFLSFDEFIESIKIPKKKLMDFYSFKSWCVRYQSNFGIDKLYEEFRGTLTGNRTDKPFLSKADYADLGIKQSLFLNADKDKVYDIFSKYLDYIKTNNFYDPNIISYEYLGLVSPVYDFVVVDEIQDLTAVQVQLLLKALKSQLHSLGNFIFCGDSNQIVHPNFFSWSKIKSLLYKETEQQNNGHADNVVFTLNTNYRNSKNVTDIANNVLKIKQKQFGSIDKESNYLIESLSQNSGEIFFIKQNLDEIAKLDQASKRSAKYAVIVLSEELKNEAKKYFSNPLVFSIHEAKGLEYDNIILFNIVSSASKRFEEIGRDLSPEDLQGDLKYSRPKDKSDKTLEAYKFYINAFYVAITRAVENLYVVEEHANNRFLELLNLKQYDAATLSIKESVSSLEEWQKEANKLQSQGKLEQAQNIRDSILKEKTVPWQVLTEASYQKLLNNPQPTKSDKILAFEYALIYSRSDVIDDLQQQGLKAASRISESLGVIRDKYYSPYTCRTNDQLMKMIKVYGINFKNQFNQTPIMVAAEVLNSTAVELLMTLGADAYQIDNNGITALQNFLDQIFLRKQYAASAAIDIYQKLASSISISIDGKLVKLDPHMMEFFMYNALLGVFVKRYLHSPMPIFRGFSAKDLTQAVIALPDAIIPARRKRREYISYILSKNERSRQGDYNRKLFFRLKLGYYILNPDIEIKVNDTWLKIYDAIGFDPNKPYTGFSTKSWLQWVFQNLVNKTQDQSIKNQQSNNQKQQQEHQSNLELEATS